MGIVLTRGHPGLDEGQTHSWCQRIDLATSRGQSTSVYATCENPVQQLIKVFSAVVRFDISIALQHMVLLPRCHRGTPCDATVPC